jgi:SOS response associated peptidase (SRAP)
MEAGFILTVDSTHRSPLAQTDLAQMKTRPFPAPLIEVVCGVPVVTKYILLIIGTASSYGQAFRKRRRLIPADGFYERRKVLSGKIPYNVQMKDGRPVRVSQGFGKAGNHPTSGTERPAFLTAASRAVLIVITYPGHRPF